MRRALIAASVVVLLLVAGFGGRVWAERYMARRAMTPRTLGNATPATQGLTFSRLAMPSEDRTLIGWWVRAAGDSGKTPPALLFLHGNRSTISDYVALQKFLYRQGVSSFVFDYSGFGASGGSASLTSAVVDARNAARVFADSAGAGARKVAMGSALGSTVLLQAIDSVQPYVDGLVIEGVPASVRESAVRDGKVPGFVARFINDVGDNVAAARRARVPVLAVQSVEDNRTPVDDAQRVVTAVPGRATLVRHPRKGHSALLNSSKPCDWAQVLSFIRTGELPAAKVDTTDICAAERIAIEKTQTAAVTAAKTAAKTPVKTTAKTAPKTAPKTATKTATKTGTKATATVSKTAAKAPTTTKTKAATPKALTTKASTATKTATKAPVTATKTKTATKKPAIKQPAPSNLKTKTKAPSTSTKTQPTKTQSVKP